MNKGKTLNIDLKPKVTLVQAIDYAMNKETQVQKRLNSGWKGLLRNLPKHKKAGAQ